MNFLSDWLPLAPLRDEEIYGAGVAIKEEDFERDSSNVIEDYNDAMPAAHRESHEVCGKKFLYKSYLTKHMRKRSLLTHIRVHTKEKPYSCEVCKKAFSQKPILLNHMRIHTKAIHMRIHTKEKLYSCDVCKKAFSQKSSLVRHMRVHTKEKPYSCEVCEKAFSKKQHLDSHTRNTTWHLSPLVFQD
ncbi:zinc finger protein OZF-like [Penaeus japonicus]|uniref:zinc finger protein OZF-like n=1 Tax=Penaeus japonicus TaxID=27405 RepID=UPI001C70D8C6|nr:zinc finger protein OZF-like [Penaeus japonicus]